MNTQPRTARRDGRLVYDPNTRTIHRCASINIAKRLSLNLQRTGTPVSRCPVATPIAGASVVEHKHKPELEGGTS